MFVKGRRCGASALWDGWATTSTRSRSSCRF
jgi:hypothetical protein